MSKRCARVLKLISKYPAGGVPPQGGTAGAPPVRHQCGRPSAEWHWKEGGLHTGQRVGRVSCGQEVGRATGRSSLSASSARPTSCPRRRPQNTTPRWVKKESKKSNRVEKLCRGGDTGDATRPTGENCAKRAIEAGVGFLPDLPSATRKGSAPRSKKQS